MSEAQTSKLGWHRYREEHPMFLMVSLLLLLAVFPACEGGKYAAFVLVALLTLVLAGSAWAVAKRRGRLIAVAALGAPAVALSWVNALTSASTALDVCGTLILVVFIMLVVSILLKGLLTAPRVTGNTLCGAVSVYLLLGLGWAMVYRALALVNPASFDTGSVQVVWGEYLYFSYSVLTTLGFGDIIPMTPYARALVVFESILGPLYLVVLVARLVAMYERSRPEQVG